MDTLKTNKGYLLKMVFLCDAGFPLEMNSLLALTVFKFCLSIITCLCNIVVWLVFHRMSPGKPEDPRAPHTEAGSSPGSSDQRRKGLHPLLSSSSLILL